MGRREFVGYQGLYDLLWEDEGNASLAAEPYGRYGLGENERLPLVVEERERLPRSATLGLFSVFARGARIVCEGECR